MSELRKDPVTGRWVILAIERAKRPNDFESTQIEDETAAKRLEPGYFPKKISAEKENSGFHQIINDGCSSGLSSNYDFYPAFSLYKEELLKLKKNKDLKYAIIFKNYKVKTNSKGLRHACSNLIYLPVYPKNVKRELKGALDYYKDNNSCIYCDIISQEKKAKKRVILENENFIVIAPFASRFPLESWILPKNHLDAYSQSKTGQLQELALAFKKLLLKMKKLLGDFSYTFAIHTSPLDILKESDITLGYHWYLEFIPLLTRVAGFEWGTGFYINPTSPESATEYLREI